MLTVTHHLSSSSCWYSHFLSMKDILTLWHTCEYFTIFSFSFFVKVSSEFIGFPHWQLSCIYQDLTVHSNAFSPIVVRIVGYRLKFQMNSFWNLCILTYTTKLLFHQSPTTITTLWLDSYCVVTVDNCKQIGDPLPFGAWSLCCK